jgi:hypothetical protein
VNPYIRSSTVSKIRSISHVRLTLPINDRTVAACTKYTYLEFALPSMWLRGIPLAAIARYVQHRIDALERCFERALLVYHTISIDGTGDVIRVILPLTEPPAERDRFYEFDHSA